MDGLQALKQYIQKNKEHDPHVAAKIASKALLDKVLSGLNDGKGVHVESAFAVLGSLAGQACLQSALRQMAAENVNDQNALITVQDAQNKTYYYGNAINYFLMEDRLSLWSLLGGAVQAQGGQLPDLDELLEHVTASVGGTDFAVPRLPEGVALRYTPLECLQLWQTFQTHILEVLQVPYRDWVLSYGLALQSLIEQAKGILDLDKAAKIVMECAVPMSKILSDTQA